jgi:hypothetical protein
MQNASNCQKFKKVKMVTRFIRLDGDQRGILM